MTENTSNAGPEAPTPTSESGSGWSTRQPASSSTPSATPSPADIVPDHDPASAELLADVDALINGTPPSGPERAADGRFTSPAPESPEGAEAAPGAAQQAPAPKNMAELAERLGVDAEEAYKIEVTTGDGETVTLGALKDAWAERQQASRETVARERGLDEREAALQADQRLMSMLAGELKGKVSPAALQAVREKVASVEQTERGALLRAMPELQDQAQFDGFRRQVVEALVGYGFRANELTISDHRVLLVMRDYLRTKARLDKLLAYEPDQRPPAAAATRGRTQTPDRSKALVERARSGRTEDVTAAIAGLIGG